MSYYCCLCEKPLTDIDAANRPYPAISRKMIIRYDLVCCDECFRERVKRMGRVIHVVSYSDMARTKCFLSIE